MKNLATSAAILLLAACSNSVEPPQQSQSIHYLTVLHTNDHHGRFWHNKEGEYGMAARQTLLSTLREQASQRGDSLILLSGGDINTGLPESDLLFAEPDFKGMSLLGYDAMAIGNHEFDNPLSVLEQQSKWANFPLLSANIIDKKTGKPAYTPYTLINDDELQIAIIGLTTTDTAKIANPDYVGGFDFIEPSTATIASLEQIKRNNSPDVVIALTHMGHYDNGEHGINASGDVTLARALPFGAVDMIIGGHSQEPVCMEGENKNNRDYKPTQECKPDQQNGTWIMQAHEWGKYVGEARFKIEGDVVSLQSYELHPVNLKDEQGQWSAPYIEPDEKMTAFLSPYQRQGQAKLSAMIGQSEVDLNGERNRVRFEPTNLAQLILQAQQDYTQADFAIISGGGIRSSIAQGSISYKDVLKVHPFKNRISYIDLSAEEALSYIKKVAAFPADSGAYTHFKGVSARCVNGQLQDVKIAGKAVDMNKTYRMSINSYNASGGDGYPRLNKDPRFVDTSAIDAQVLKDYIKSHSPITAQTTQLPQAFTCR